MLRLVGIVGTNARESTNRKLLEYVKTKYAEKFEMKLLEISHLPIMEIGVKIPSSVIEFSNKLKSADAVIIAAPEYDHAPTASLLNALSWLSYKIHPLSEKPVLTINATHGLLGSPRSQNILKQVLSSPGLNAKLNNFEFILANSLDAFDTQMQLSEEKARKLDKVINDFLAFVGGNQEIENQYKWDDIL